MELIDDYLTDLTRRMREILGEELVGVYAGGSYSMGAYEHGRSDVDVTAVVAGPLAEDTKRALVAAVRHEALPCPARGLELVVYPRAAVETPTAAAGFELNLNTGARMDFRADFEPGDIEGFWFAIDRSILREHGVRLLGPPPEELFAPIPRDTVVALLDESVRWHRDAGVATSADVVLNTARSQHFLDTGHWISKPEARQRLDDAQGAP
jgi:hypothetical protein